MSPDTKPTTVERPTAGAADTIVSLLRSAEHQRNRDYALGELVFFGSWTVVVLFLGGDPQLRLVVLASSLVATASGLAGRVLLRRPAFNRTPAVIALKVPLMVALAAQLLYLGVLSPLLIVSGVAVYYYALSESRVLALVPLAIISVFTGGLLLAISAGVLPDRSLIGADRRELIPQLGVLALMQVNFVQIWVFGVLTRRANRRTLEELDAAVREAGKRQALLAEARQDLDVALAGRGRLAGQRAGPWVLDKVLGRGGMGEVYAARREGTPERAAVKLLTLDPAQEQQLLARFKREAEVMAKLECAHVVKLLDVGELRPGEPYFAMELLEGADLSFRLRQDTQLTPGEVVTLVQHVAAALEAARHASIVHRDVKPQNLFWDTNAKLWKVLDFGISKLGSGGTLTAGVVLGTVGYMAPEQASGEEVDHRADIFSLTAVAYRCLTGRPAFTGDDHTARLVQLMTKHPPRPSSVVELHADFDLALGLGLGKKPAERVATAAELAQAIAEAAEGRLSPEFRERGARLSWGG